MTKDELRLANYHLEYLKNQRKYFEYADTSQFLLEQQKDNDLLLLQEAFTNWIQKIKKGDLRANELTLLLQSIWRLQSYCGNLETICRASVSSIVESNKRIERLESEKRILELQILQINSKHEIEKKKLEQEIEFITKNG
jgi:hypothetical protein